MEHREEDVQDRTPQEILKALHRAKYKERKSLITEREKQGWQVRFEDEYVITDPGQQEHRLASKRCQHCHRELRLSEFWGKQGTEHPWCLACRAADPQAARKASDHARFKKEYHEMSEAEKEAWREKIEKRSSPRLTKSQRKKMASGILAQVLQSSTEQIEHLCQLQQLSQRQTREVLKMRDALVDQLQGNGLQVQTIVEVNGPTS